MLRTIIRFSPLLHHAGCVPEINEVFFGTSCFSILGAVRMHTEKTREGPFLLAGFASLAGIYRRSRHGRHGPGGFNFDWFFFRQKCCVEALDDGCVLESFVPRTHSVIV
jgi:hypothetical protein